MNNSINPSEGYAPKQALIIYEKGDDVGYDGQSFYIEHHNIQLNESGKAVLLAGKPLMKETLKHIGQAIIDQEKPKAKLTSKGVFAENLLYFNQEDTNYKLVWYQKASRNKMYFTKGLNIPTGEANIPTLIFVVKNNSLQVYATKTKSRPNEKTKLYRAPFHNTNDGGAVCLGNAKKPTLDSVSNIEELIEAWENVFWFTKFSEVHGKAAKTDVSDLWRSLVGTTKDFPNQELIPVKTKLNQLL